MSPKLQGMGYEKDFVVEGIPYRVTAPDSDGDFLVLEALPGARGGMKVVGEGWIHESDYGEIQVSMDSPTREAYRGMEGPPAVGEWELEQQLPEDWLYKKWKRGRRNRRKRGQLAALDAMRSLREKIHPSRFPGMSPMMAAIVGMVVGEEYATPALVSIRLTPDGHALGRQRGDTGFNAFLGSADDLAANWFNLIKAADLEPDEVQLLSLRMNQTIRGPASKKWLRGISSR